MTPLQGPAAPLLTLAVAHGWTVLESRQVRRRLLPNTKVSLGHEDRHLIIEHSFSGRLYRHQTFTTPGQRPYLLYTTDAVEAVIETHAAPPGARQLP